MRINLLTAITFVVLFPQLLLAAASLPSNAKIEPLDMGEAEGMSIAKVSTKISVPIPAEAQSIVLIARTGKEKTGFSATLKWEDKTTTLFSARVGDEQLEGQPVLSDCYLQLTWNIKLYIRPDMKFYRPEQRTKVAANWQNLPAASEHFLCVEFRRVTEGTQVWVDGRFVQQLSQNCSLTQADLTMAPGAAVRELRWDTEKPTGMLPLSVKNFARPGTSTASGLSLKSGAISIDSIPFQVALPQEHLEVAGLGKLACPSDDLVSFYWSRSTLNGLPETRIISVPLDTYSSLYVLCAAEEDSLKIPEFTVRLTRYGSGRGDAMADTIVRLPAAGAAAGTDLKLVGSIEINGKKTSLWLVRVPLKNGIIQDLIREDERKRNAPRLPTPRYLDLELLDPITNVEADDVFPPSMTPTNRAYVPRGPVSSVHIFGLTLERSSAELTVSAKPGLNMFYAAENPEFLASIKSREDGTYTLAWEFADIDGAIAASGKTELSLNAAQRDANIPVPVKVANGWYATRFRLLNAAGRELVDHRASFVMLPPDTRKAGFDSPHGTWWFHWAHGGEANIERVGPALQRAGLRHTTLPKTLPESLTAPYGVTAWCIMWKAPTKVTVEEWLPQFEAHIQETLKAYPNLLKTVMLFHESGSYDAPFPSEIWGEAPPPIKPENDVKWQNRMKYVVPLVKMIREKFPELKIQIGNDGDGCRITAELLRRGLLPKDYDYVAVEDLGQTFIPESPILGGMQSAWFLRQTARKLGNPDAKVTGCYEWLGRRNVALGLKGQAEWYVRDALQARAYEFHSIAIGTIHDAGMGYYHTIWGAGGLCFRYPYMYPKPSYAGIATLTRVLDSAKFQRTIPTGSLSLYGLEFQRGDEWVYAFWTPRGNRHAKLKFASDADVLLTNMYGREDVKKGRDLELSISTAAQYLTSKVRLETVSAGKSWFPGNDAPKNFVAVDPLDSLNNVVQSEMKHLEQKSNSNFPHRTKGNFEVREVQDEEKGKCIELELKPEGKTWEMLHEHVYLKLKNPVIAPGACEYAGIWVKGNAGWGDVMWEVADSKGQGRLLTSDWTASAAINFDGWYYLRLKLPEGPTWRSNVKILGLVASVPRQMLYVNEMIPVPVLKIRLKDLSLF